MRVVSGTNRNGTPHDTIWTGSPVPVTAAGESDSAAAVRAGSGIVSPKIGSRWVIHAKLRSSPAHVSATGTAPMLQPNTNVFRPRSITPARASANVVPIVGWPAIGSSSAGVKIRIRTSVPGLLRRQQERRLRKVHFLGDRLHGLERQPAAVEEDRELVSPEEMVGEDVVVKVAV